METPSPDAPTAGLTAMPAGLAAALSERDATPMSWQYEDARAYVTAAAPDGGLFARFTRDRADAPAFAREVAIRRAVGDRLPLRAPPVLRHGDGWTLERELPRTPPRGSTAVAAVIDAARAVAALSLPELPAVASDAGGWARRARSVLGGVRPDDRILARRSLQTTRLPLRLAHGDFHAGNLLCAPDGPWVIDWELCAPRPQGYDLLSLWPTLADADDRAAVLEAALADAGPGRRADVLALHHALLVRALAAVTGKDRGVGGHGPPAHELRGWLREARRATRKERR